MTRTNPIRDEFQPQFDEKTDQWVIRVSSKRVAKEEGSSYYKIRLPLYLTRTYLGLSGAILGRKRRKYAKWLLEQPEGKCKVCGEGQNPTKGDWCLDHQPPLISPGSKFIDYENVTANRVIHRKCDVSQTRKKLNNLPSIS